MIAQQLRILSKDWGLRLKTNMSVRCYQISATMIRNAYNGITQYRRGSVPGNAGIVLNEQASWKCKGRIYKDYKFHHRILPVRRRSFSYSSLTFYLVSASLASLSFILKVLYAWYSLELDSSYSNILSIIVCDCWGGDEIGFIPGWASNKY